MIGPPTALLIAAFKSASWALKPVIPNFAKSPSGLSTSSCVTISNFYLGSAKVPATSLKSPPANVSPAIVCPGVNVESCGSI